LAEKTGKPPQGTDGHPAVQSLRVLILVAIALALVVVFYFSQEPSTKTTKPLGRVPPQGTPSFGSFSLPLWNSTSQTGDHKIGQLIRSVRLVPYQPSKLDILQAEVIPAVKDASRLTYSYVWEVNNKKIRGTTGNSLDLSNFQKRDLVSVTVTPYEGKKAGYSVSSPFVVVYGVAPSLELKAMSRNVKTRDPLVLQLSSVHPETGQVTFALTPPLIQGMTIDGKTGKITWVAQPCQDGTLQFGASVSDTDGSKVTKVFKILCGRTATPPPENQR
jgi:hypothetical protein